MKHIGLLCIAFLLAIQPAFAERITIVGDPWCPYNCEPGTDKAGFMIDIAREIFKEHGIEVEYKVIPWSRAIKDARKGKYNAVVGAYKDDVPDFIFPQHAMAKSSDVFFKKRGGTLKWHYKNVASLEKVSVGFVQDYTYGKELDDYIAKYKNNMSKVQIVSGDKALEQNVKKLVAGRVQVVIENEAVMQYYLNSIGQTNALQQVGKHNEEYIYIAFSPSNPKSKIYAKILSDGVKQYKQSGKLQKIIASYGIK